MLEICAIGPEANQRWRRRVPVDVTVRLGRAPSQGWAVPWDLQISREHVDLSFQGNRLSVSCLLSARNPVYHQGKPARTFVVEAGDEFRIGQTRFQVRRCALVETDDASSATEDGDAAMIQLQRRILKACCGSKQSPRRKPGDVQENLETLLDFIDRQEESRPDERH